MRTHTHMYSHTTMHTHTHSHTHKHTHTRQLAHTHTHTHTHSTNRPADGEDNDGAKEIEGLLVVVGGAVRVGLMVGGIDRVGAPVGVREGVPLGLKVLGAEVEGLDRQIQSENKCTKMVRLLLLYWKT